MEKILRVTYSRKANRAWKNTIELNERAQESIKKDFGTIATYLRKMISEPIVIDDHYLIAK